MNFLCILIIFAIVVDSYKVRLSNLSAKWINKSLITASVAGCLLSPILPTIDRSNFIQIQTQIQIAHADSTGKFSTKLTARKRYLPRIENGVKLFLQKDDGILDKDEAGNLIRAMGLYGASLRKGEYPDEISKKAQSLTDAFEKTLSKKGSSKEAVRIALDEYLNFAGLDPTDSQTYR